jgi:hypothetical protein
MIAANQDVEQVNARAAELTALAWESAGEMKQSAQDTSDLMRLSSSACSITSRTPSGIFSTMDSHRRKTSEKVRKTLNQVFSDLARQSKMSCSSRWRRRRA